MKITQEQLDKDAQASLAMVSNLPWIRVADDTKQYHCDYVLGILAAHFGEPIEVIEPEPEIPDAVLEAARAALHKHKDARGYCTQCVGEAEAVLTAAYKAGWGGMRK